MADHDMPGNDGRWFLELVGAADPEPQSTSTFAELAADQTRLEHSATVGIQATLDLNEDAITTNGAPAVPMNKTDEFQIVATTGIADPSDDPLTDWQPEALSPRLKGGRRMRWTFIGVAAAVVLGLVAAGFLLLPGVAEREAQTVSAEYEAAVADLRNVLPQSQVALGAVTDPTTPDESLGGVILATADLEATAHSVNALGTDPLPSTPPLVPRGPLNDLEPVKAQMVVLGAEGQDIASQLSRGYLYRTAVPLLLTAPDLPTEADTATLNLLAGDLASSLADTVGVIADLPAEDPFLVVRATALEHSTRFGEWQLEYLNALGAEDLDTVAVLLVELDRMRSDLARLNSETLLVLRVDVDRQIIALAGALEVLFAALSG